MIFLYIFLFILLIIAVLTRYINPDRIFRFYSSPVRIVRITQNALSSQTYQIENGVCVLQDWIFRAGNIKDPSLNWQTKLRPDGIFILRNSAGQEFQLGKTVIDPIIGLEGAHELAIDPGDQAIFQVSRSIIPYYYGWNFLSPVHLFRYFRYYTLSIRQPNGATLRAKWKFSTYKLPDGTWVPDYLGLRGEGLMKMTIQKN